MTLNYAHRVGSLKGLASSGGAGVSTRHTKSLIYWECILGGDLDRWRTKTQRTANCLDQGRKANLQNP